jgi:Trypsin-co-occurring domain 1
MTHLPAADQVGLVRWTALSENETDDDDFGPASPLHADERRTFWRRSVDYGHEALATSSEAIAVEVDVVAERMMAALEQRHADRQAARDRTGQPDPDWQVTEVGISFGVQLTGSATIAVSSAEAEASAQITLTFTRTAT